MHTNWSGWLIEHIFFNIFFTYNFYDVDGLSENVVYDSFTDHPYDISVLKFVVK